MPDFTARITAGATLTLWNDPDRPPATQSPDDPGAPSRLNPLPDAPHRRFRGQVGVEIEVSATIGGVEGPLDAALGGRLFRAWLLDQAGIALGPSNPAGQSSVQRFTPLAAGAYTLGIERDQGGAIFVPVDVEA